jgi:SET domain-containing protein
MLLVKTTIGPSKIEGIGIFAAEPINKGAVIWEFNPLIDILLTREQVASLSVPARDQMHKYSYFDQVYGKYLLCGDDARFFNHDDNPNCYDSPHLSGRDITVASRDIAVGEELTCNYKSFYGDLEDHKEIL